MPEREKSGGGKRRKVIKENRKERNKERKKERKKCKGIRKTENK